MRSFHNPFESLIESAASPQEWFTSLANHDRYSDQPGYPTGLVPPLNLGVFNKFDSEGTKSCMDPDIVFGAEDPYPNLSGYYDSASNFWSCVFYPNFTGDYRESRMTPANQTFVSDLSIDVSAGTARNVTSFLSSCLIAYCQELEACKSESCSADRLIINGTTFMSASATDQCVRDICRHDPGRITTPDVAGIGVIASYSIQLGVALISIFITIALALLHCFPGLPVLRIKETFLVTLDEFQRAQCCFVMSVAIATLVAFRGMTDTDITVISVTMAAGFAPTLIVMALLMVASKLRHSSFTFWIALVTWFLSLLVSLGARNKSKPNIWKASSSSGPLACGKWPPSYFCNTKANQTWNDNRIYFLLPGPVILTVLHLIPAESVKSRLRYAHILWFKLRNRKLHNHKMGAAASTISIHDKLNFAVAAVIAYGVCHALFEPLFSAFLGLASVWREPSTTEWSFSQIIAITVWLPTMFSFVNDCVYGPLVSRTRQLPKSLKVVREKDLNDQLQVHSTASTSASTVSDGRVGNQATGDVPLAPLTTVGNLSWSAAAVRPALISSRGRSASV